MDGELNPVVSAHGEAADTVARAPVGPARPAADKPKTVRWLVIVGVLLALVLGGLYGFNRFRAQAIADFFAHNKPPPAQISAVKATSEAVPHFANGIGSLAAVHQVTVMPEIGGRVTAILFKPGALVAAGDPLVHSTTRPSRATSPITRRRRGSRPSRCSARKIW